MEEGYLTTAQAAARLGVTRRLVRQLCKAGRLEGVKRKETERGDVWLVPVATVEKHAAEPLEKRSWRTGTVGRPRKRKE